MWISITLPNGNKSLVDFSKVIQLVEHRDGTQLLFDLVVPNKEGVVTVKHLVAKEPISAIARLLKAKAIR